MTLADRLTRTLTGADAVVNGVHDALNDRLGPLWWPLEPPEATRTLGRNEHALYAAHVAIALAVVRGLGGRRQTLVGCALAGAIGWAVFTGAWDRRAYTSADSAARRSR